MIKFIIYKSINSFSCQLKINDKYRELLKSIDGLSYDELNNKLIIPIRHFKHFIQRIKELLEEITLKVYEIDTSDETIIRTIDIDDDEEEYEDDDNLEQINKKPKITDEMLLIQQDEFILIPIDQQKKSTNQIIASFDDFSIDIEKWMWKIPRKHKDNKISFIECY